MEEQQTIMEQPQTQTVQTNEASSLDTLALFVNSMQEVDTQFQIWHWNTRGHIHEATEEVYKGLIDPIDQLAESYIVMARKPYTRERNPAFTPEWTAEYMNKVCQSTIIAANKLADSIPDEAIKGVLGDIIAILRTAMFKIG